MTPDHHARNPHFEAVQSAQARRVTQAMRLSDEEILAAMRDMAPARALKLARTAQAEAVTRAQTEAWLRPVVAE